MTEILKINSSVNGDRSTSNQLTNMVVTQLQKVASSTTVTLRDLGEDSPPHLNSETLQAITAGEAKLADELINEVIRADIIVIGAPMYNFSIPSTLKAWFDHIARAGTTFEYTANGPKGLLTNKKVYVVTTRGGFHKGQPSDHLTPLLTTLLNFIGLTDIEFLYAEGLNITDTKDESLARAIAQVKHLGDSFQNSTNQQREEQPA